MWIRGSAKLLTSSQEFCQPRDFESSKQDCPPRLTAYDALLLLWFLVLLSFLSRCPQTCKGRTWPHSPQHREQHPAAVGAQQVHVQRVDHRMWCKLLQTLGCRDDQ